MPDFTEIFYLIDSQDRLVTVSPQWLEFALNNHGEGLTPEHVAGRSLWDFISDDATRELYKAVLAHVRSGARTELVLRCDAPERRRLIEMNVLLLPDGNVEFKTVLLASKPRPAQRLLDKDTPRTAQHVMVCSWCDQVNTGVDQWGDVEVAMELLHLTRDAELPMVDPVVCPKCYARVQEIISGSPALES